MKSIPIIQRIVAILWPSFIVAGIATIVFTTAFDPDVIFDHEISRLGGYTISFFLFWLLGAVTATLTCYFLKPCESINKARADKAKADKAKADKSGSD